MPDESVWEGDEEVTPESKDANLEEKVVELPELVTAADLLSEEERDVEPAELGFEPEGMYLGQQIVMVGSQDPRHDYLFDPETAPTGTVRAFYVQSKEGTYGLVPFAGSTIIWPHEKAWEQDLYHEQQSPAKVAYREAYLKVMREKQKKS